MNILLLTADSLRADRTTLFDHSRDTTPFLADYARKSFEFRRAYANGRNTATSFPAIHTSMYQSYYDGIGLPPDDSVPTLAEVLANDGYETYGINTNELISRDYNYHRGFDIYRGSRSGSEEKTWGWRAFAREAIGDGWLFRMARRAHFLSTRFLGLKIFDTADTISGFDDQILHWSEKSDGDWFIWAHFMNSHHPYTPPEDCQEALGFSRIDKREAVKLSRKMRLSPQDVTQSEQETIKRLYDASVLSWDREVQNVIQRLTAAGQLENTLVVITADHGELLGENGVFGHPPHLQQYLLRVPLLFNGSDLVGQSDNQIGLIDLAPTVLNLTDIELPAGYEGRPRLDASGAVLEPSSSVILCETGDDKRDEVCAIDGQRKIVYDAAWDSWESFDLSEDGFAQFEANSTYEDLRDVIRKHVRRAKENRRQGADINRAALEEDLRALGYLDE